MAAAAASCADLLRRLAALLLVASVAGCWGERDPAEAPFDFYVLSLSWSPSYCATDARPGERQCRSDVRQGFIVHGLWPQNESGWPEFCEPGSREWVPDEVVDEIVDLIPSPGLIGHQWRKHGSCSGLSQQDYFEVTRRAREKVAVPELPASGDAYADPAWIAERFAAANRGLPADGLAVTCDATHLREVRICMTRDLEFRSCPEVAARSCTLGSAVMPPP